MLLGHSMVTISALESLARPSKCNFKGQQAEARAWFVAVRYDRIPWLAHSSGRQRQISVLLGGKRLSRDYQAGSKGKTPGDVAILITPFNHRMGESSRLGVEMAAESSGLCRRFLCPSHFCS